MARTTPATKRSVLHPPTTFDVTCVIGTVAIDEHGELPPGLAAFKLIHDHATPGTYKFPNEYGADTTVIIAHSLDRENVGADIDNYADMDD